MASHEAPLPDAAAAPGGFGIEVCYAPPPPAQLSLIALAVEPGCTVAQAIRASGVLGLHPEIDLGLNQVGIFGKLASLEGVVSAHDRVEIYRPLTVDPKVARQRRVQKNRATSTEGRKWQAKERKG